MTYFIWYVLIGLCLLAIPFSIIDEHDEDVDKLRSYANKDAFAVFTALICFILFWPFLLLAFVVGLLR